MDYIIFLIFRRMRAPLLVLIVTYSGAILGMVLIPGQDAAGNPWHMDFFHAFYFISFMATPIGFGEIPYEFTDAQRLWVTFSLYSTVVAWIYSIGTLITLVQDAAFKQALVENYFATRIKNMRDRFYLVCGYGNTGSELVEMLTERGQRAVVVEIDHNRVSLLKMQNLREYVPVLCGDASRPKHLLEAGINHPKCAGVVAVTNFNEVNLKIAITSKLLHRELTVVCRTDSLEVEANMASFGTDHIINPFDTFATYLAIALKKPGLYLLHEWLSGVEREQLKDPIYPPRKGLWVLCGFGRFGKAVYKCLREEGIETVVIEVHPDQTGTPEEGCIVGWGTEAVTLREANIENAVGLVAGTHNDTNNLSIIMTARELNPELFVVARQNLRENQSIMNAVQADFMMYPYRIIANKIHVLLGTPLLHEFKQLAKLKEDNWACELISRIVALVYTELPTVWEVELNHNTTHAICNAVMEGRQVTIGHIINDPRERTRQLPCICLLLMRNDNGILLPELDTLLRENDRLLFCGHPSAEQRMEWTLQNEHALSYVLTGEARPQGFLWRLFQRKAAIETDSKREN